MVKLTFFTCLALAVTVAWSFYLIKIYAKIVSKSKKKALKGIVYGLFLIPIVILPLWFLVTSIAFLEKAEKISVGPNSWLTLLAISIWACFVLVPFLKMKKTDKNEAANPDEMAKL